MSLLLEKGYGAAGKRHAKPDAEAKERSDDAQHRGKSLGAGDSDVEHRELKQERNDEQTVDNGMSQPSAPGDLAQGSE